ncbi:MAG: hypothetical protein EA401_10550 [Planctomycetota bacterium]|nr:MAG: hypothetical protein EA401_10550 [Planctomycetota bacterium]
MVLPILLPDVDVLLGAFDRLNPSPLLVQQFAHAVEQRQVLLPGWVRQGVLTRVADVDQALRLARVLLPFPDIPICSDDHMQAAFLQQRLRRRGIAVQPAQALHWIIAERIDGLIWSASSRWHAAHSLGAPVLSHIDVPP